MIALTLDASVLCKWYLDPALEPGVAAAQTIAVALRDGNAVAVQPPHWIAEVGAVVSRILPDDAEAILDALHGVGAIVASQPAVYPACSTARDPDRCSPVRYPVPRRCPGDTRLHAGYRG